VNTCRALWAAGHEVAGIDKSLLHLEWAEPYCVEMSDGYGPCDRADVVYAQADALMDVAYGYPDKILMPGQGIVALCQDKFAACGSWFIDGLRSYRPIHVGAQVKNSLRIAAEVLGYPYWLRASEGAGARGATLVDSYETGFHWVSYWRSRGVDWSFVAEEYLPGREFCWTSLWYTGHLVAAFSRERLEWIYPHLAPSGRTGTPAVARVVHDDRVSLMARDAIRSLDQEPHGIYCVDLVEDHEGNVRPTEVNAGRWATTSPCYSPLGVNLPDLHVTLAAGGDVEWPGQDIYPEGVMLTRHIDCGTHLVGARVAAHA